jgi:hypothetical protein
MIYYIKNAEVGFTRQSFGYVPPYDIAFTGSWFYPYSELTTISSNKGAGKRVDFISCYWRGGRIF